MDELHAKMSTIVRRLKLRTFTHNLSLCLLWALWGVAGLVVIDKLYYLVLPEKPYLAEPAILWGRELPGYVLYCATGLVAACLPAALILTYLSRITELKAAVLADERLGLKERLSSAIVVSQANEPMAPALRDDALHYARRLDAGEAVRFDTPRRALFAPIPVLCAVLVFFLAPDFDPTNFSAEEKARDRSMIAKKADELDKRIKKLKRVEKQGKSDVVPKVIKKMEKVRDRLKSPSVTREKAVKALADLSKDLRKLQEKAGDPKMKSLAKSGKAGENLETDLAKKLSDSFKKGDMEGAMEAMKQLQKRLKDADRNSDEIKKLGRDLERLAKNMDPEKMKRLQEEMKKFAKAMKDLGIDPKDPQNVAKAMDNLADIDRELQDIDQMIKDMQALRKAIAEAGKMKDGMGKGATVPGKRPGPAGKNPNDLPGLAGLSRPYKGKGKRFSGESERPMGAEEDNDFKDVKAKGLLDTKGKFLAGMTVKGMPPEDANARVEYVEAVSAAAAAAEEALPKDEVPAKRRNQVKRYFDSMRESEGDEE